MAGQVIQLSICKETMTIGVLRGAYNCLVSLKKKKPSLTEICGFLKLVLHISLTDNSFPVLLRCISQRTSSTILSMIPLWNILLKSLLSLAEYKELVGKPIETPNGTKHSWEIWSIARLDLKLSKAKKNHFDRPNKLFKNHHKITCKRIPYWHKSIITTNYTYCCWRSEIEAFSLSQTPSLII